MFGDSLSIEIHCLLLLHAGLDQEHNQERTAEHNLQDLLMMGGILRVCCAFDTRCVQCIWSVIGLTTAQA